MRDFGPEEPSDVNSCVSGRNNVRFKTKPELQERSGVHAL